MGYRVEYQPMKKIRNAEKKRVRLPALTALFILLFLLLVNQMWPQGRALLRKALFPGDTAVTTSALDTFADELKAGNAFSTSFRNFCCTILECSDDTD